MRKKQKSVQWNWSIIFSRIRKNLQITRYKTNKKNYFREWTKRSSTIGKNVKLNTVDGEVKGKAIKIDEDGTCCIRQQEYK